MPVITFEEMTPYEHTQRQREKDALEGKPVGMSQKFSHWIHTWYASEDDLKREAEKRKAEYESLLKDKKTEKPESN